MLSDMKDILEAIVFSLIAFCMFVVGVIVGARSMNDYQHEQATEAQVGHYEVTQEGDSFFVYECQLTHTP